MQRSQSDHRRAFLQKSLFAATGAVVAPTIVRASVWGSKKRRSPSNRVAIGLVGCGGQGRGLLSRFLRFDDVQAVAVCDVDSQHLAAAQQIVNKHYGRDDCQTYRDFRDRITPVMLG